MRRKASESVISPLWRTRTRPASAETVAPTSQAPIAALVTMMVGRAWRASLAFSGEGGGSESLPRTAFATSNARWAPEAWSFGSERGTTARSRADGMCERLDRGLLEPLASAASSSSIVP